MHCLIQAFNDEHAADKQKQHFTEGCVKFEVVKCA